MKETSFGALVANALSAGARGLGYFLWFFLRLIYRREPRVVTGFAVAGLAIAAIVWLIVR